MAQEDAHNKIQSRNANMDLKLYCSCAESSDLKDDGFYLDLGERKREAACLDRLLFQCD